MSAEEQSFLLKVKQFLERLLALKVTEGERVRYADDPLNVFGGYFSNQRLLRVAAILAVLFHIVLFLISLPFLHSQVLLPSKDIISLVQLAQPSLPKAALLHSRRSRSRSRRESFPSQSRFLCQSRTRRRSSPNQSSVKSS